MPFVDETPALEYEVQYRNRLSDPWQWMSTHADEEEASRKLDWALVKAHHCGCVRLLKVVREIVAIRGLT